MQDSSWNYKVKYRTQNTDVYSVLYSSDYLSHMMSQIHTELDFLSIEIQNKRNKEQNDVHEFIPLNWTRNELQIGVRLDKHTFLSSFKLLSNIRCLISVVEQKRYSYQF